MALDLILRNARTPDLAAGAPLVDIGIAKGVIAAVQPRLAAAGETLDVGGKLVAPGLIESHLHLDKSRIMDRSTAAPDRGRDHMARVSAVKPGFTEEDIYARASKTLEACIVNGTTHVRTHVEVDPNVGMKGVHALEKLARDYRWAVDLELCVFAQEGMSNVPQSDANVVDGLRRGAAAVGGAPGYDPDRAAQIRRVFALAKEFGVPVDLHLDVGFATDELDVLLVCELTEAMGWGGRVAVGHGTKYSYLPPAKLRELGARLAGAGVTLTVLPATDLYIMGRNQDHAVARGVTDAHALMACGANCCLSTNNVLNPFTPFGDGSLVRIANLYANTVQRAQDGELAECFEMLTRRPARLLGLKHYGLAVGDAADLAVWDAATPAEAVATIARPLFGFKRGRRTFTRARADLHRP